MARTQKALVILGLGFGLAVAAALFWRQPLVEAAARRALAANGLEQARLDVVEVGTGAIVIENLALGPGLPEIRRLRLAYAPGELVSGRLGALRIEGLRHAVPANLEAALAPLAPLLPGEGGGGWLTLPRVEIEDGLITLAAPADGTIGLDGAFDLSGNAPGAALDIALGLGAASGAFRVRSEALGEGGSVAIDGGGEAELAGMAFPGMAFPGAALTGGRARFTLQGVVRIPALDAGLEALHGKRLAMLTGGLELAGVTDSLTPGTLAADIGWTLDAGDGMASLALSRPARLSLTDLPAEALAALGLAVPDGAAETLAAELAASGPLARWTSRPDGGSLALAADLALSLGEAEAAAGATARLVHDTAFRLSGPVTVAADLEASGVSFAGADLAGGLRRGTWSVAGSLHPSGELALEGPLTAEFRELSGTTARAASLSVDGALRLSRRAGHWSLGAAPGLALVAEGAAIPGRLALSGPLALTLETLSLEPAGPAPRLDLKARAEPVSGAWLGGDETRLAFTDAAGEIAIAATLGRRMAGELTLAEAALTLPGYGAGVSGLGGRLPLGAEGPVALTGVVRDTGAGRFPPLDVALEGRRTGEAVAFSGAAEASGAGLGFPLEGGVDLAAATARMTVGPTRLAFRRGGLQPRTLTSLLPAFADVEGGVRLTAEVRLDAGSGLGSAASLDLEDLSLSFGEVAVAGLSGRLRLAGLAPLVTAGPQELTARRVIAGVPLDGGRARFSARAHGAGIAVHIHEATGGLSGGSVLVEDAHWDTAARSNAIEVRVRDVQLSRLLSDWHIEGISGSGRLSGVVPVRLGPAGVAVEAGRLDAAGPGVIQVDWGSARETLVNSGEQVALTVRALEDFRYASLSLGIDQPPEGELALAIGLEGANPEVLDGHPFRFNINLSGELAPILEAVREGRRLGTGLLRGGLGGQ